MPDSFYLQSCPNDFAVGGQRVPGPESECLSLSLLTIKTRKSSFQRHAQRKQPEPGWIAHIALMPAWSSDQSSDTPSWCCRLGCSYVSSVAAWTPCWINSVSFFFELWNYSSVLPTVELLFIDSWCCCFFFPYVFKFTLIIYFSVLFTLSFDFRAKWCKTWTMKLNGWTEQEHKS